MTLSSLQSWQDNGIVVSLAVPEFAPTGLLPPGIHEAEWEEFRARFGGTPHRQRLLAGLEEALFLLAQAGCAAAYVDGSFVTAKERPSDFDACWDVTGVRIPDLDPVLMTFANGRAAQKARFGGELFPAQAGADKAGSTFLAFFQVDKGSGAPKGIVMLSLARWQT